ncbi:MAG: hypothetical protein ACYC1C_06175 [Chloroflexota bacterium]
MSKKIGLWFALGIAIRLALMPFTFHMDLFWEAYRSHLLPIHGTLPADFFLQVVPKLLYGFITWVTQPFFPDHAALLPDALSYSTTVPVSSQTELWRQLANTPGVHLLVFFLKIPTLIADLASGVLLLHICKERPRAGYLVLIFWMLNPLNIYSAAIYGRHDIVGVFFILLSLLLLKRGRPISGTVAAVLGVLARLYLVVFLPFLLRAWAASIRGARGLLILGASAIVAIVLAVTSGVGSGVLRFFELPHGQYLIDAAIPILQDDKLYVFVAAYVLVFMAASSVSSSPYTSALLGMTSVGLLMMAFVFLHPAYYALITPFIALLLTVRPPARVMAAFTIMVVGIAGRLLLWDNWVTTFLFGSVLPFDVFDLPGPGAWIEQNVMPVTIFIGLSRSLLAGASLFLLGDLWYSVLISKLERIGKDGAVEPVQHFERVVARKGAERVETGAKR